MAETSKSFIKKFVGFSLVTWISFAISFFTAPISTRLFPPEVLGKINIFDTYTSLFGVLVLLGIDQSFVRFYHERPNNRSLGYLLTFCYSITYAFLSVIIILSIPFSKILSWELFGETDNFLLYLFFISVFCTATLRYQNLSYRMGQNILFYNIQGILTTLVSKVLYLGVGFWSPTYKPAILVLTITRLLLVVAFLIIQRKGFERLKEYDKVFSKEMFKFALPLVPVSVLMWANTSIPQIVIQKTMDYYSLGVFSAAVALANIILVVQSGFNTFWVPYTYENYKTQTGQFFKVHRYLVCILTLFALLVVCSQDIIFLLLGEKYRAAKVFFPFLILGPTCYIIGEVAGVGIGISKKSYLSLFVFGGSVIVNIVLCLLLRIPFGVSGIAMATSIAAITSMVIKTVLGERYYKVVTDYKYMLYCIIAILASSFFTLWVEDVTLRLVLCISVLLLSCWFFRIEIKELYKVGLSFIKK